MISSLGTLGAAVAAGSGDAVSEVESDFVGWDVEGVVLERFLDVDGCVEGLVTLLARGPKARVGWVEGVEGLRRVGGMVAGGCSGLVEEMERKVEELDAPCCMVSWMGWI